MLNIVRLLAVCFGFLADISFAVGLLSRALIAPTISQLDCAKHVLRYLRGTSCYGIIYNRAIAGSLAARLDENPLTLYGFVDASWADCPITRRSTSGFILMLCGGAVSWLSKRQSVVAISSAEAEFVAASRCGQEVCFLRFTLELGFSATVCYISF